MKSEELRSLQAPLKQKYRNNPSAALVTLKATGLLGENVSCRIESGRSKADAGLHPATGGDGSFACSGDMLLEALAACAGVTMNAIATSIGIDITGGIVRAEGDIDFRGTLGLSKEVPVGFQNIRLFFDLRTEATEEQIATLIKLTERYCVVYQTIRRTPEIKITVIRN